MYFTSTTITAKNNNIHNNTNNFNINNTYKFFLSSLG